MLLNYGRRSATGPPVFSKHIDVVNTIVIGRGRGVNEAGYLIGRRPGRSQAL
jgi:hypothetical protein